MCRTRFTRLCGCLLLFWLGLSAAVDHARADLRAEPLEDPPSGSNAACPEPPAAPAFDDTHADRVVEQWWRIRVRQDWPVDREPVLILQLTFFGEVHARLPGTDAYQYRSPLRPGRNNGWPGRMAVFEPTNGLSAGEEILVCTRQLFRIHPHLRLAAAPEARAQALAQTRIAAITEGTILAMTLAALGMSLALGSRTFMSITAGLALAFVYLVATNGTVMDFPGTARLARDWPLQRIGGIGASIMIGWGLALFIDLHRRHPALWKGFRILLVLMAALWLISVLPTPLRFVPVGLYSNALMILMIAIVVGSAIVGALRKHRPSRLMLWSWTPLFVIVTWLALIMPRDSALPSTLEWLFPLTLVLACGSLFVGLAERFSRVRTERDMANLLAETDELTGALSRLALDRSLVRLHAQACRNATPLSILFIDFDRFKQINDTYGHAAGDRALRVAVETIASSLRGLDRVGRYGGEEFIVALDGVSEAFAIEVAERIRSDVENAGAALAEDLPPMTVSIGVATLDPASPEPLHSLLSRADQALMASKRRGRNRVSATETRPSEPAPGSESD